MKCAIITAGGIGSRLYPLSTEEHPKQFVKMFKDKALIELTYKRINKFIKKENIFIVLPEKYKHFINELIPSIKNENIIIEPAQKSTAPCILYSILKIKEIRNVTEMFVFPADHYIKNNVKFLRHLNKAYKYVKKNKNLILLGIKPKEALTRYGYLKAPNNKKITNILEFKEKPNQDIANQYLIDGNYFWSSDISCFNVDYMLYLYKKYDYKDYKIIVNGIKNKNINKVYNKCESICTAKAIYENAKNIAMLKCNFLWDDVGVFESLLKYTKNKNVLEAYSIYLQQKKLN